MNTQLEGYQDQLLSIRQQVPGLVAELSEAQFTWSPGPKRWSMAHCFDHLNVTARAFLPAIDRIIEEGRTRGLTGTGPFALPLFDRLFLQANEPPPRLRFRVPKMLAPAPAKPMQTMVDEFMEWQEQLGERIRRADGLDLRRARGRSPVSSLLSWSLGGVLAITLAHERRHLWQARQVRNAMP